MKKAIVAFLVIGVNTLTINFSGGCMPYNGSSPDSPPAFPPYSPSGISVSSSPRSPIFTKHGVIFPKSPLEKRKPRRYSDVLADLEPKNKSRRVSTSSFSAEAEPVPLRKTESSFSDLKQDLDSLLKPSPSEQRIIDSLLSEEPYEPHKSYSPTSSQELSLSSSDSDVTQPCNPEPRQEYKKPAAPSKKGSHRSNGKERKRL